MPVFDTFAFFYVFWPCLIGSAAASLYSSTELDAEVYKSFTRTGLKILNQQTVYKICVWAAAATLTVVQ